MWESSASDMNQLMENGWNNCLSVHLKVEASLLSQSQELFQHESSRFFEDGVHTRMDQSGVTFAILFSDQNLILHMEMRDVVLKINIFGDDKHSNDLIKNFCHKTEVSASWVDSALIERLIHLLGLIESGSKFRSLLKIILHDPLNIHVLVKQRVSVHDVKNVLESVLGSLSWMGELAQELRLNDGVRLSDDEIISIWVLVESVLQEVCRS